MKSKYTTKPTDIKLVKIKELRRNTEYFFTNSKAHITIGLDQLQGRMISIISRKFSSLIKKENR